MILARDYQTEAVSRIWNYFYQNTGNPLVAMPTGTGKSVVIALFCQSVLQKYPRQKILVLTHVKELIRQNYGKFLDIWPFAPASIYSAGLNEKNPNASVVFGGIGSVHRKPELFGWVDLVIIDEAHLLSPNDTTMYKSFLASLSKVNKSLKVIGFTATPWRLGQGKLTDEVTTRNGKVIAPLFTDICFDITSYVPFNRLIDEGYLIPLIPKKTKTKLDVEGVATRGGEYIEKELQTAVNKSDVTEAAIKEAIELGANRKKWLVFATGVDHAEDINDMLQSLGVSSGAVHSKRSDRDVMIKEFLQENGDLQALVNNNVLTTGFDAPHIDLIIGLRPSLSSALWVQMLGRGTRPVYSQGHDLTTAEGRLAAIDESDKHNCLVLDYARNSKRLGPVNDPVIPKSKGKKGGEAPIKECEVCGSYNHPSVRYCTGILDNGATCGHEFTFQTKIVQSASSDELIRADLPIVEVFRVDHITYSRHEKVGSNPSIRVSYYCGNVRRFDEYFCPQHSGFAHKKAARWWSERTSLEMPDTVDASLPLMGDIKAPTHLRVWINKKYPEILAYDFDGTGFGDVTGDAVETPTTELKGAINLNPSHSDDEIPF